MIVWILKCSEVTAYDAQASGARLFRYGMFSEVAVQAGHRVVWWTDDFDHYQKQHRFGQDHAMEVFPRCTVRWIHTPGYQKNVSVRRFRDHKILGLRFEKLAAELAEVQRPDIILASMPADAFCASGIRVAQRLGVPVVVDVRDCWPEVFFGRVPWALRWLLWLMVRPIDRRVRWAFSRADAIIGNTQPFVDWGLRKAGRSAGEFDRPFPLGYKRPQLTNEEEDSARAFWMSHGINQKDDIFRICFFGTMGPMYEYGPILEAARALDRKGAPVQFVLCGKGELLEELRRDSAGLSTVSLPGWVNGEQAWMLMRISQLGLAPYQNDANFRNNLPNKPFEYLSASLPFLVSIEGLMEQMVREHCCGARYRSGAELADLICQYRSEGARLARESANARGLFEQHYSADAVYGQMIDHLRTIVERTSQPT